tara:strand:- start:306 stop:464 length:159 start_codon:yes stop_codon:yes gene_type:complete
MFIGQLTQTGIMEIYPVVVMTGTVKVNVIISVPAKIFHRIGGSMNSIERDRN